MSWRGAPRFRVLGLDHRKLPKCYHREKREKFQFQKSCRKRPKISELRGSPASHEARQPVSTLHAWPPVSTLRHPISTVEGVGLHVCDHGSSFKIGKVSFDVPTMWPRGSIWEDIISKEETKTPSHEIPAGPDNNCRVKFLPCHHQ